MKNIRVSLFNTFFIRILIQVKVKARIPRSNKSNEFILKTGSTVNNLLEKLNMKPDTLIVMRDKSPIPIDEILNDGDDLTIILVSSGG